MNKKTLAFTLILSIFTGFTSQATEPSQSLYIGTIQFPQTVRSLPAMRIYYFGHKITCETNNETHQLLFTIPKIHQERTFYLFISEAMDFETEENTIKYIKPARTQPYLFYRLELVQHEQQSDTNQTDSEPTWLYSWKITSEKLDNATHRIPDNTIIICCPPTFIEKIEGGTALEFPHIIMKKDLLSLTGSEKALHEKSTELLLSAIDYDTVHKRFEQAIKSDHRHNKTIIACTTQ